MHRAIFLGRFHDTNEVESIYMSNFFLSYLIGISSKKNIKIIVFCTGNVFWFMTWLITKETRKNICQQFIHEINLFSVINCFWHISIKVTFLTSLETREAIWICLPLHQNKFIWYWIKSITKHLLSFEFWILETLGSQTNVVIR